MHKRTVLRKAITQKHLKGSGLLESICLCGLLIRTSHVINLGHVAIKPQDSSFSYPGQWIPAPLMHHFALSKALHHFFKKKDRANKLIGQCFKLVSPAWPSVSQVISKSEAQPPNEAVALMRDEQGVEHLNPSGSAPSAVTTHLRH